MNKLAELLYDVSARYFDSNVDADISAGSVVEILGEYPDDGFWSDDDPV